MAPTMSAQRSTRPSASQRSRAASVKGPPTTVGAAVPTRTSWRVRSLDASAVPVPGERATRTVPSGSRTSPTSDSAPRESHPIAAPRHRRRRRRRRQPGPESDRSRAMVRRRCPVATSSRRSVGAPADARRSPARTGPMKGAGDGVPTQRLGDDGDLDRRGGSPSGGGRQSKAHQPALDQERPPGVGVAPAPGVGTDAFGHALGQLGQLLLLVGEGGLHHPPACARRVVRVMRSRRRVVPRLVAFGPEH